MEKLIIEVRGGLIVSAYASEFVDNCTILDWDNIEDIYIGRDLEDLISLECFRKAVEKKFDEDIANMVSLDI